MIKFISCLLFIALAISCFAQREIDERTPPKLSERIYFGGGFGLGGGTGYFSIALNPIVGYMVTPKLSVGTGINWSMTSYTAINPSKSVNQYGISPFVRYNFDQLFMYGEYNLLSTNFLSDPNKRQFISRFLLGLGYSQPLGKRGAINVVGLYDVLYKQNDSPFASPWVFRVFFSF